MKNIKNTTQPDLSALYIPPAPGPGPGGSISPTPTKTPTNTPSVTQTPTATYLGQPWNINSSKILTEYFGGSVINIDSLYNLSYIDKICKYVNGSLICWDGDEPSFLRGFSTLDPNTGYLILSKSSAIFPYTIWNYDPIIPAARSITTPYEIATYLGANLILEDNPAFINNITKIFSLTNNSPLTWIKGEPSFVQGFGSLEYGKTYLFVSSNTPYLLYNSVTPTPTATQTQTPTITPTSTATPTATASATPTATATVTPTVTPTETPTNTPTVTSTVTPTATGTATPTATASATPTATATVTPTVTPTETPTNTPTVTSTATPTATGTATPTATASATPTATRTATPTATASATPTATATVTPTVTSTTTPTPTPIFGNTPTPTPTQGLSSIAYVANFDSGDISIIGAFTD